jgi:hypothetical protein
MDRGHVKPRCRRWVTLPRHLLKHPHGPNWPAPHLRLIRTFSFRANTATICRCCAYSAKERPQNWGRSHYRMHYSQFGVAAGGGVNPGPGTVIGLLGGVAGVVIGELTVSFEATRVG